MRIALLAGGTGGGKLAAGIEKRQVGIEVSIDRRWRISTHKPARCRETP